MKELRGLAVVIVIIGFVVWIWVGHPGLKQAVDTSPQTNGSSPRGVPADYLPFTPGLVLTYEIKLGPAEPLTAETVSWPAGGDQVINARSRGRFVGSMVKRIPGQKFSLVLEILGPAGKQGPYSWDGVEVRPLKDDLGVFKDVERLFWARSRGGELTVLEIRTYPPGSPGSPSGPWGAWGAESGYSSRVILFGNKPGTMVALDNSDESKEPEDALIFEGASGDVLHFVRRVATERSHGDDPSREGSSALGRSFEEHTWFEYRKGLVRLEQRVDGDTSMTWELVSSGIIKGSGAGSAEQ